MEVAADLDLEPRPVLVIVRLVEVDLPAHVLEDGALDLAAFQVDAEIERRDGSFHPDLIIGGGDDIVNPGGGLRPVRGPKTSGNYKVALSVLEGEER